MEPLQPHVALAHLRRALWWTTVSARCPYCARTWCSCSAEEAAANERDYRAEQALEEAAYVAACVAHGLVPYSSREMGPDEARERMEELEQSRKDLASE